jgi:aspartyl-tRNA(Asn)/glutamyl-tRNA(Gln) amidotransferase subunit C
MKKLTKEDIEHTAYLARIKLSEKEVEKFEKELNSILEYMEILNEVDTSNVAETSQVTGLNNKIREDGAKTELSQDKALSNAPIKKKGYFVTKRK